MAKKKSSEEVVSPEPQAKSQRSIITSATEGEIVTSRVKTTRELYMELVDAEKN